MSWIDTALSSGWIVWIGIALFVLHLYMKKTGKTLPDIVRSIRESLDNMRGNNNE